MAVDLDDTALVRWRASPIAFIEEMLHDPETGRPFVLLEAERAFMRHAFTLDRNGRLAYPELVYGAIKKSGKTTCAALIVLVMVLLRSDGRFAEGYCIANDLEQAQSRVFLVVRRIVEASPLLRHGAKITSDRISFPRLMPASLRSRPTRRLPLVAIRRSLVSTSFGATPASVRGVFGTR
jgi:hypothetical protein